MTHDFCLSLAALPFSGRGIPYTLSMALSHDELKHLANLARLQLSEQEMDQLGGTLERILGYVGRLSHVDTSGVSEIEMATNALTLRVDEAHPSSDEDVERFIALFPDKLGQLMRVPGVFEKPKG